MPKRILSIIVLYKMRAQDSQSYRSLLQAAERVPASDLDLQVLLYNNTPEDLPPSNLPAHVRYIPAPANRGLSEAYNGALDIALEQGYEWLLTLDQDTSLPEHSLRSIVDILNQLEQRPDVAAVAPIIRAGGRIVSPNMFIAGAWPRWFPSGFSGIPEEPVYAFNSASLVRVSALRQIGGYSPWFWLDNSDAWLYRQIARFGKRVYVAGQVEIDHDFSMLNMQERVSPARYEHLLLAESAFWDLEMNALAAGERNARLLARLFKHVKRGDASSLRQLTQSALKRRFFWSRQRRIALWKRSVEDHLGKPIRWSEGRSRPMVSVCMATYNSRPFLEKQLLSVVPQLSSGDEIVIVDDESKDDTVALLRSFLAGLDHIPGAPNVRLVLHPKNLGVVHSFEDAVRSATGDILFLCDGDDIWSPDKVQRTLDAFAADPHVQVVASGLQLIDSNDRPLEDQGMLKHRKTFSANVLTNLMHNQFQGSTMAFRSTLLHSILPFPAGRLFLHDAWIGLRNTLTEGSTCYIDQPLLLYRRHGTNFSNKLTVRQQIQLRLQLIAALLHRKWFA